MNVPTCISIAIEVSYTQIGNLAFGGAYEFRLLSNTFVFINSW